MCSTQLVKRCTHNYIKKMKGQQIREIRERLGLSRRKFADLYHVSAGTLHGWEIERFKIPTSAQVLMTLIDREPDTIARILNLEG